MRHAASPVPESSEPAPAVLRPDAAGKVAVQTSALVRKFGDRPAVSGVSFSLGAGECLAIFGPNGAGKSTLLRLLAGVLRPNSGTAQIGGVALPGGAEARARSGFVGHGSMLYGALTALENVIFAARMYSVRDPAAAARLALDRIGASQHAHTPVRLLSRGQQQRVSIARAMVHSPDVLLLDEPFSGLDAPGSTRLATLLMEQRRHGSAMIVVTHNMPEGLALATHCAIMIDGALAHFESRDRIDPASYPALYHELVGHGE